MPLISVYIPAHNYGKYLDNSIKSVISQTMDDWELIVIDDGSTDNTKETLEKYKDHPKIRIIEQENKGLTVSNNIAIRTSVGKYIIRLDADDYFDENCLLILSNILNTKPDIGLVYPDYYNVAEDGDVLEIVRRKKIGEDVELLDLPAHGACTMIRKEILIDLQYYDETFKCQDGYYLWLKFIQKYCPYNVNVPLFYYRQHANSLTKQSRDILTARREIKEKIAGERSGSKPLNVLGIIPVVRKSIYPKCDPFIELAGKPLIWHSLSEASKSKNLDRIVLSSDDDETLEYASQFPKIVPLKRPGKLARYSATEVDIIQSVLSDLEQSFNYKPDAICMLYSTTPLRRAHHIDKAVDTMTIFDVESVVSIQEELALCYFHRKHGLTPINNNKRNMRIERNGIYKENGAVYLSRLEVVKSGRFLGDKIGHITMLFEESVKLNSEFEFWLAEKILNERALGKYCEIVK